MVRQDKAVPLSFISSSEETSCKVIFQNATEAHHSGAESDSVADEMLENKGFLNRGMSPYTICCLSLGTVLYLLTW